MYCENLREIRCQLTKVIAVINWGPPRCIHRDLLIAIFVIGEQNSVLAKQRRMHFVTNQDKKLSYRRETARQLPT